MTYDVIRHSRGKVGIPQRVHVCYAWGMEDDGNEETIHYMPENGDSERALCGLNIMRTPYTYASPVPAEVDCKACRVAMAKR